MARSNRHLGPRPVVRIATAGVALGVALMILASAIVQGFQHEVKQLVVGFDSHIQVAPSDPSAEGLVWTTGMLDSLRQLPGVAQVTMPTSSDGSSAPGEPETTIYSPWAASPIRA